MSDGAPEGFLSSAIMPKNGDEVKIFFSRGGQDYFTFEDYNVVGVIVRRDNERFLIPYLAIEKMRFGGAVFPLEKR